MKKRIVLGMLCISSLVILTTFSGCFDWEPIFPFNPYGGTPTYGGGSINLGEQYYVEPGIIMTDSVGEYGPDSMKLYGHFTSHQYVDRKASIAAIFFEVRDGFGDFTLRDTVIKNVEWKLHSIDTTILFETKIAAITATKMAELNIYSTITFRLVMVVNNNLPGIHEQERYEFTSFDKPIVTIEPLTYAIGDSVTYLRSNKAILWGHIDSRLDAEVIYSGFKWQQQTKTPLYDTIAGPTSIIRDKYTYVRDTIDIIPNTEYTWHFFASLKFKNDSLGYIRSYDMYFTTPM